MVSMTKERLHALARSVLPLWPRPIPAGALSPPACARPLYLYQCTCPSHPPPHTPRPPFAPLLFRRQPSALQHVPCPCTFINAPAHPTLPPPTPTLTLCPPLFTQAALSPTTCALPQVLLLLMTPSRHAVDIWLMLCLGKQDGGFRV